MEIKGSTAIVTGGASGLGAATARMLSAHGAKVVLFDLNEKAGQAVAQEVSGLFLAVDITDDASVTAALDTVGEIFGQARILTNCAGIAPAAKTVGREHQPHALQLFRKTVEVNLIGTFNVATKFAARLSEFPEGGEERGVIVNTASIAAFDGQIGQTAYAASKGGIVSMTLPMARDLAPHKIRVATIAPGIFKTPMVEAFPQPVQEALGANVPHPSRLGNPSEFAQLVEAIIRNPMLNGEVIRLDGAVRMAAR